MTRAALLAAGLALLLVGATRVVGIRVDPVIGTVAVVVCCLGAALLTRMPPAASSFAARLPQEPEPHPTDRRLTQLAWQVRAAGEGDTWAQSLQPQLTALVDERLARTHGIDRSTDPDQAREVLDPELWRLVTDPHHRPRSAKALRAVIERIHAL